MNFFQTHFSKNHETAVSDTCNDSQLLLPAQATYRSESQNDSQEDVQPLSNIQESQNDSSQPELLFQTSPRVVQPLLNIDGSQNDLIKSSQPQSIAANITKEQLSMLSSLPSAKSLESISSNSKIFPKPSSVIKPNTSSATDLSIPGNFI
ncbi:hypothetical protein BC833DRAFT_626638 [Globomyces pollinis-pini]|nr:hypothetical protein BC833DRAFT_626638 [Globomyces pollinis-pini]